MKRIHLCVALALLVGFAGCQDSPISEDLTQERQPNLDTDPVTDLDVIFEEAGDEFGVPVQVLKAIGFVETGWRMVEGEEEFEGRPAAFGVMALRGEHVAEAAALLGASEEDVRMDARTNIRGAAAILQEMTSKAGNAIESTDIAAWAPAVASLSDIDQKDNQSIYVHEDVYGVINEGVIAKSPDGSLIATLLPMSVRPDFPEPPAQKTDTRPAEVDDYSGGIYRPSPWWSSRPSGSGGVVQMVIIHTCEGSYTGCWSWLTSPNNPYKTSAHYVVNESGSEVSHLVYESRRAHHAGVTYRCSRNDNTKCNLDGNSTNNFTVGIEHGGYASQSSFSSGLLQKSAKVSCSIAQQHNIPIDRQHFVAHGTVDPVRRTDPGANWPWSDYMNRIREECGEVGGGGGEIIVDSNNANNDMTKAQIAVSNTWIASNYTPGYYGTGYYYNGTKQVSDGATFWFYLDEAGSKSIDVWYTAGSNRSRSAPFLFFNSAGQHQGTRWLDQSVGGKAWTNVGTYNFTAGWNRVILSRWTTPGYVVLADAIRVK